jgi:SAM-dependent methyltransferase
MTRLGTGIDLGAADLVLCVGASHALSEASPRQATIEALSELRRLVNPGGRVFFGECFWEHPPTPAELAAVWSGITAEDHDDLATLVERAISAGFRPEWIETASLQEWDDFESSSATLMAGCIPRSRPSARPRPGGHHDRQPPAQAGGAGDPADRHHAAASAARSGDPAVPGR